MGVFFLPLCTKLYENLYGDYGLCLDGAGTWLGFCICVNAMMLRPGSDQGIYSFVALIMLNLKIPGSDRIQSWESSSEFSSNGEEGLG